MKKSIIVCLIISIIFLFAGCSIGKSKNDLSKINQSPKALDNGGKVVINNFDDAANYVKTDFDAQELSGYNFRNDTKEGQVDKYIVTIVGAQDNIVGCSYEVNKNSLLVRNVGQGKLRNVDSWHKPKEVFSFVSDRVYYIESISNGDLIRYRDCDKDGNVKTASVIGGSDSKILTLNILNNNLYFLDFNENAIYKIGLSDNKREKICDANFPINANTIVKSTIKSKGIIEYTVLQLAESESTSIYTLDINAKKINFVSKQG